MEAVFSDPYATSDLSRTEQSTQFENLPPQRVKETPSWAVTRRRPRLRRALRAVAYTVIERIGEQAGTAITYIDEQVHTPLPEDWVDNTRDELYRKYDEATDEGRGADAEVILRALVERANIRDEASAGRNRVADGIRRALRRTHIESALLMNEKGIRELLKNAAQPPKDEDFKLLPETSSREYEQQLLKRVRWQDFRGYGRDE